MISKIKISSTVLFLSIFAMFISYGQQKAEWKGKIEYDNGIKIIKNPSEPLYGEITFELEEDLSIGREDDENYVFYKGVDFVVDDDENIFVLDRGNCRIQKFDKDGKYLQTIGRKGQGPGEFEHSSGILLDTNENIYVKDGYKLSTFGEDGKFKESIILEKQVFYWGITKEGNILGQAFSISLPDRTMDIVLISSKGKRLKTIASYPYPLRFIKKGAVISGTSNPFGYWLYFCMLNSELGIFGYSSEYKLFFINSLGETVSIIEKKEHLQSYTKKEKERIIRNEITSQQRLLRRKFSREEIEKAYKFPKYKAFYGGIISDNLGNIYVLRFSSDSSKKRKLEYDLFSREGYYFFIVRIKARRPVIPHKINKGFLYTRERDSESGYLKIKRFKIKNWEEIKEGI